jgi:hypothetical protein
MSEGWGDFNGLLLQMREGDNRDGTYAQGSYADANGTPNAAYFSIRRFPYSRDRTKNDLSFRHIGDENPLPTTTPGRLNGGANSEVHNAGEVWTSMLWEAFNVLADEHGVPVARRRITDYAVAGLLLTPPEATFTEARDAILAAASALDTDDMILMAAAFAGRGAGSCAASPARNSATMTGVVESGTIAAKLATSRATVSDDGTPSDRDGALEPGESGSLRLTISNSSVLAAEDVVITAMTTTAGVTLGKPINAGVVAPLSQADVQIPIKVATSVPSNAPLDVVIQVTSSAGCGTGRLAVELHQRIGAAALDGATLAASAATATHTSQTGEGVVAIRRARRASLAGLPVFELP